MKNLLALTLGLCLCLGLLVSCGPKAPTGEQTGGEKTETKVIKVAATPAPHTGILEVAKEVLKEEGITLEISTMNDYKQPNFATESGDVMANYFQHIAYLDKFNEEEGTNLVNVAEIHYEPYGLYAGKTASVEALTPGATILVTNDVSNQARALSLLETQGLIKMKEGVGLDGVIADIVENKLNLKIMEMEAAQLPAALPTVDMAVINGNYAIDAGLSVDKDAVALEKADDSDIAAKYANVLVVKEGNENNELVLALKKALQSDRVREYITTTYADGSVVPLF